MSASLTATIRAANTALIDNGNLHAIAEFFAPDYTAHLTDGSIIGGHAAIRRFLSMLRRAFPQITIDVEILVEGEDRVAWQRTMRAVQEGPFHGFPASNREIVWRDMVASRFDGDLIAEEWVVTDLAERLLLARKS